MGSTNLAAIRLAINEVIDRGEAAGLYIKKACMCCGTANCTNTVTLSGMTVYLCNVHMHIYQATYNFIRGYFRAILDAKTPDCCCICDQHFDPNPNCVEFKVPMEHTEWLERSYIDDVMYICQECSSEIRSTHHDFYSLINFEEDKCPCCEQYYNISKDELIYRKARNFMGHIICYECLSIMRRNINYKAKFGKTTANLNERFFDGPCKLCNLNTRYDILRIPAGCDCEKRMVRIQNYCIELEASPEQVGGGPYYTYIVTGNNVTIATIEDVSQDKAFIKCLDFVEQRLDAEQITGKIHNME